MKMQAEVSKRAVPDSSFVSGRSGFLQRKCACGGSSNLAGACQGCQEKEHELQREVAGHDHNDHSIPPLVHEVLRTPGQPLDNATRERMEARLGHDFSKVRVHTEARAAESARAVNALAYTVGTHIVFGENAPRSGGREKLLVHELVHVVQQQNSTDEVVSSSTLEVGAPDSVFEQEASRIADEVTQESPGITEAAYRQKPRLSFVRQPTNRPLLNRWLSCGPVEECPPRASGEEKRASAARLRFGVLPTPTNAVIYPFDIDSDNIATLASDSNWVTFRNSLATKQERWEILGFTDCTGAEAWNTGLRARRADNVYKLLPAAAKANIDQHGGEDLSACVSPNDSEPGRALNRSVVFHLTQSTIDEEAEVRAHACPPTSDAPVTTVDDYVFLLMCAEKQMGLGPREMLAVFRQLYYGKPWSGASQASLWDKVIPCSPNIGNPEPKLGKNLFNALVKSRGLGSVHVGHLFTGLEAMTCPSPDVDTKIPFIGVVDMSNEEFATWGGDIGAAVAAFVACPQLGADAASQDDCGHTAAKQPLTFYLNLHAPAQELEGDIDSFVARAQLLGLSCGASPQKAFTPTRKISEIFHDYYMDPTSTLGKAHSVSYLCALLALGGTIDNSGRLSNRSRIEGPISRRVANFADPYFTKIKMKGSTSIVRGFLSLSDVGDRTRMRVAAHPAVDWFLDWLVAHL